MLALEHVSKTYRVGAFGGQAKVAVDDAQFSVAPGEVVALIGESGSGKTTIGRMILRLISVTSGRITFDGTDVSSLKGDALRAYYRSVQGVFQDPFSSFNPIFKVDHVFAMLHGLVGADAGSDSEWSGRVEDALHAVGLDAGQVLRKYPHQLSGGQLQRVLIARALLLDTRILVADEIISMLDASTRIDVLNLLGDLKARGLGILFISHDLSLANYISERAVILRRGRVVELGDTTLVFGNPLHPYTQMLLASVPRLHERWGTGAQEAWGVVRCWYHECLERETGAAAGGGAEADGAGVSAEAGVSGTAGAAAQAGGTGGAPPLMEVEANHAVACADPEGCAAAGHAA